MFCLKCGAAISDNSKFCPECGASIKESFESNSAENQGSNTEETIVYSSQTNLNNTNSNVQGSLQQNNNVKRAKKLLVFGIVLCVVSAILFVFGVKAITNSKYRYALENYDYYESQMNEARAMSNIYGRTGILGGGYANLASSWKDMLEKAKETITITRVKAGIGFCGGSIFILFGVILIVKNIKKIKMSVRSIYDNSDTKKSEDYFQNSPTLEISVSDLNRSKTEGIDCSRTKAGRIFSIIAGICFVLCGIIYLVVSLYGLKFGFNLYLLIRMVQCVIYITFAVLLFRRKINKVLLIVSGLIVVNNVIILIMNFSVTNIIILIAYILFFVVLLMISSKKYLGIIRFLCIIPAPLILIGDLLFVLMKAIEYGYGYYAIISFVVGYMLMCMIEIFAILFTCLWIREDFLRFKPIVKENKSEIINNE